MARRHVASLLNEWNLGDFAAAAEMITNELVANAVEASASAGDTGETLVIQVYVIRHADALTIECWDQAPGVPVLRQPGQLEESGRGLAIIDGLTGGAWDSCPATGRPGKCVWAEMPLDGPQAPRFIALPLAAAAQAGPPNRQEGALTAPAAGPPDLSAAGGSRW
jgi:hypothetical protein